MSVMKRLSPNLLSRILMGLACIGASAWVVVRSYNWIHATWFSSNTDLTVPIMAAMFAGMLVWTGFSTMFKVRDDRDEEVIEALEDRELYEVETSDTAPASIRPQPYAQQSRRAA
jgi:hypothetical protein